jgi:hypothetical protein
VGEGTWRPGWVVSAAISIPFERAAVATTRDACSSFEADTFASRAAPSTLPLPSLQRWHQRGDWDENEPKKPWRKWRNDHRRAFGYIGVEIGQLTQNRGISSAHQSFTSFPPTSLLGGKLGRPLSQSRSPLDKPSCLLIRGPGFEPRCADDPPVGVGSAA